MKIRVGSGSPNNDVFGIRMKVIKEVKISYWAHHLTTIISVTLVLLLMGMIALLWVSADKETRRIKEQTEISVIMGDSIPSEKVEALVAHISASPYAHDVRLITKEEALDNWTRDMGENLEELYGVNPLSEEISFGLTSDYATPGHIAEIQKELSGYEEVADVTRPDAEVLEIMNENISRLTLVLGIVAGVMLLISFVLINNTVHLTIYSRRFTIHTMQLVGATDAFIRKPVILDNMLAGMIAGLVASALITVAVACAGEVGLPEVSGYVGWDVLAMVAAGLVLTGVVLCGLASWCSANVYLRKDYDQLFK